jgi:hypothetical protein
MVDLLNVYKMLVTYDLLAMGFLYVRGGLSKTHCSVKSAVMDALRVLELVQEEMEEFRHEIHRRALRVFPDRKNPLEIYCSDYNFIQRYSISKTSLRWSLASSERIYKDPRE